MAAIQSLSFRLPLLCKIVLCDGPGTIQDGRHYLHNCIRFQRDKMRGLTFLAPASGWHLFVGTALGDRGVRKIVMHGVCLGRDKTCETTGGIFDDDFINLLRCPHPMSMQISI